MLINIRCLNGFFLIWAIILFKQYIKITRLECIEGSNIAL
ncbi:MAG: hypothetical protein ACI9SD_001751 [Pseudohongiellaceae bacterium]|jgi:hypothetical protein